MGDEDDRFAVVSRDPRFKSIPRKERKVKIDRRFQAMFKDKKFKLKYSTDKRGRPTQQNSTENLKRFYEISDDSDSEESGKEDSEEESEKSNKKDDNLIKKKYLEKDGDDNDLVEDGLEGMKDHRSSYRSISSAHSETLSEKKRRNKKRLSGREELRLFSRNLKKSKEDNVSIKDSDDDGDNDDDDNDREIDNGVTDETKMKTRRKMLGTENEDSSNGSPESSGSEDDESEEKASFSLKTDFSRGEALLESSSSDSEDSDSDGNEAVDLEHEWGELDAGVVRGGETSSRLALCNMDWDRVTAQDLLMLLDSFKPSGRVIKYVKIYISDFGLERLKEEEVNGPKELVERDTKFKHLDEQSEKKYFREKLRKYQLQRFKYYYAVVECDSRETANSIYEQCDGFEFESSAVKLDLRFIPDDVSFDNQDPRDTAISGEFDMETYKPLEFVSTALQQSKVDMTWDEDDHRRVRNINEAFEKNDLESMDLHDYLASSSGSEENDAGIVYSEDENDCPRVTEEESLAKYRALVRDLDNEKQAKEDADMEMEVTWEPGLKDTTEELVSKKLEEVKTEDSPWQKFLKKKKDRKKEKKAEASKERELKKKQSSRNSEEEEEETLAFSDDDLPPDVDLQDSYFEQSTTDKKDKKKKKQSKKMTRNKGEEPTEEDVENDRKKAELELLMMDEEDHKQHFNLKDIMKQEKSKTKKRKKRRRVEDEEDAAKATDNFEMDVRDSRFDAIYSSHHFAIDPSDPQFKRTKAMTAILEEKQTRRARDDVEMSSQRKTKSKAKATEELENREVDKLDSAPMSKTEVSALVKSIKRNTGNMVKNKLKEKHKHR